MTLGLVIFVVEEVIMAQVILQAPPFSPTNIILPMLHTHLDLRTKPGNLQKNKTLSDIGDH
jgi:hypothetical protein